MNKWLCGVLFFLGTYAQAQDYSQRADVQAFVQQFADKHEKNAADILAIIAPAKRQQSILDAIAKPAERVLTWGDYQRIFIEPKRLEQGVQFWRENRELVERLAEQYQVAPEIILAIIGVETRYGRVMGNYKVLDALLTLGFDYPPRATFFRSQLEQFLLLVEEQGFDAQSVKGSYAGAMGYGQFIAGSYRAYAVDGDDDKRIDILHNTADAIASVANYFVRHGWQAGGLVAIALPEQKVDKLLLSAMPKPEKPSKTVAHYRQAGVVIPEQISDTAKATLMALETKRGTQYWLGFNNFYVISRYNHSHLYSMAVHQFSQLLRLHVDMP